MQDIKPWTPPNFSESKSIKENNSVDVDLNFMQMDDITMGFLGYLLRAKATDNEQTQKSIILKGICDEHFLHLPSKNKEIIALRSQWTRKVKEIKRYNGCIGVILDFCDDYTVLKPDDDAIIRDFATEALNLIDLSGTKFYVLCAVYHNCQLNKDSNIRPPHMHVLLAHQNTRTSNQYQKDLQTLFERYYYCWA